MDRRRVIVAGGSGYIGSRLCLLLAERGYEPVVLTRDPAGTGGIPGSVARYVPWNGRDEGEWYGEIDGAFGVVNLTGHSIASGRWTGEVRGKIRDSRTGPARAIRKAIEASVEKPAVLVQGSATGYYGNTGEREVTEREGPGDTFLADVSLKWEEEVSGVETSGTRLILARTGVVLGGGSPVLAKMSLPVKLFAGGPLGSGRQWFSWIHVEDEIRAIAFLLEVPTASGPYNLASPHAVRNEDLMKDLCRSLGRPFWLRTPAFALRAALGQMADELVLASSRIIPERLISAGFDFRYPDIGRALAEIYEGG